MIVTIIKNGANSNNNDDIQITMIIGDNCDNNEKDYDNDYATFTTEIMIVNLSDEKHNYGIDINTKDDCNRM